MADKVLTKYSGSDDITLGMFISALKNSKNFIILVTLFFSFIASYLAYSKDDYFQSVALIEIGEYNNENNKLIEPIEFIINKLNIEFLIKPAQTNNFQNVTISKISPLERSLVRIETNSPLAQNGEDKLEIVTNFLIKRHLNIFTESININAQKLITEIENINSTIKFNNANQKSTTTSNTSKQITEISEKIIKLENNLLSVNKDIELAKRSISNRIKEIEVLFPFLEEKTSALHDLIEKDSATLKLLQTSQELFIQRSAKTPSFDQVIYENRDRIINLNIEKNNLNLELNMLMEESPLLLKLIKDKNKFEIDLSLLEKSLFDIQNININTSYSNYLDSPAGYALEIQRKFLQLQLDQLNDDLVKFSSNSTSLIGMSSKRITSNPINEISFGLLFGLLLSIFVVFFLENVKIFRKNNNI